MKMRATLPDGPEQVKRDEMKKAAYNVATQKKWDGVYINRVPDGPQSPEFSAWLLRHDAEAFVSKYGGRGRRDGKLTLI